MKTEHKKRPARIGFFCVGHAVYWDQFEGVLDALNSYHLEMKKLLEGPDITVVDYGMVDSNRKAFDTVRKMKEDHLDLVFCNMATYATSSTFAPIIRELDAPMVLLVLQHDREIIMDRQTTSNQIGNDNICAVPEFSNTAVRMGKKIYDIIIGSIWNDPVAAAEIKDWCEVARILHGFKGAWFGLMGHVLESMYDMHTDPTAVTAAFGVHVPLLEVNEVLTIQNSVTEEETEAKKADILELFDTPEAGNDPIATKLTEEDLQKAARAAVALDKFVEKNDLTGLAYYYNGAENSPERELVSSFIVGNSMLNARGVPMCGEFDIKTCLAMFIMDRLSMGGSFAELHPFDFSKDYILIGHDGPHHIDVAEGKPVLRSLAKYHGKPGSGASVEFQLKDGPITMLSISEDASGKFRFIIGEGMSNKGAIPANGNSNTRATFEGGTREFIRKWCLAGPTHHCALGLGHRANTLVKVAEVLGISYTVVKV